MGAEHTANLLGALALAIADQSADAVGEASGQSMSDAAALSAMSHFLDGPSIDRLRQVLGLTPSGTVRLVDRLEDKGWVRRAAGVDARTTSLQLTPSGRRMAARVSQARAALLAEALSPLTAAEQALLHELVAKLLVGRMRGPGAVRWICRLCDTSACGRERGECPVANEATRRFSPDAG